MCILYIYIYVYIYIYIRIYFLLSSRAGKTPNCLDSTRKHCTGAASSTACSKSLPERAPEPLGARNHCSSLLFGSWALHITARACFLERLKATERSKSVLEHASFSFDATERSKSLLERASRPLSARNDCSNMLLFSFETTLDHASFSFESTFEHASFSLESTFDHACFSFEIPCEIALLRKVICFELYFVRLHRHRKVPYANLVYIYICV